MLRVESETAPSKGCYKIVVLAMAGSVETCRAQPLYRYAVSRQSDAMLLIILASIAAVNAMPSYIAVPADQIAFLDLTALRARRVPRQTLEPPPLPQAIRDIYGQEYQPGPARYQQHTQPTGITLPAPDAPARIVQIQQQPLSREIKNAQIAEAQQLAAERPPDFGEYVDFGAHTGDNGAFGWYADYPINNQEDTYGK